MTSTVLFPSLLGSDTWHALPTAVQAMHGAAPTLRARGIADVAGAGHFAARCLRRLLGLPPPGAQQALTLTIERHGTREIWTRRFTGRRMQSMLDRRPGSSLLYERLGPATLGFALRRDGDAIDWQLRSLHMLGMPLPRALRGLVISRSGTRDGRYHFSVDVRLPMLGQLIAYEGWLEPSTDATEHPSPVIVFDGVCLLCSRWVRFLLKHDHAARYRFCAMQSASGRALLLAHGLDPDSPLSFLLVEDGRGYTDSDAIARVFLGLDRRRWRWLSRTLSLAPRWLRDPLYRAVARHRYQLFGRSRHCFLPTPEQRERFMP